MNAALGLKLDKAAFCAWLEHPEHRHEWKGAASCS